MAQPGNIKNDTIIPASQVILKNSGEKNIARNLKEKQLSKSPETLMAEPLTNSPGPSTKHKSKKPRHKK